MYELKTEDSFMPKVPERLMGPMNKADELINQLKLFQKKGHGEVQ